MPKILAFFQRAIRLHPRSRPFGDVSRRSARALEGLSHPPDSLRFKVALRHLHYDWDLLVPEAASDEQALRLQLRVLDLAAVSTDAEGLIRLNLDETPLAQLIGAIIAQGEKEGAQEISFLFDTPGGIRVAYRSPEGEREGAIIPRPLGPVVRGLLLFIETAGYARTRAYFHDSYRLPDEIEFVHSEPNRLSLRPRWNPELALRLA